MVRVGDTAMWLRRSDWDNGRNDSTRLVIIGDELGGRGDVELFIEEAEDIAKAMLELVQAAKEAQG